MSAWDDMTMRVRRDSTHTREVMREIERAMREGNWSAVEVMADELVAVWSTVSESAQQRASQS